MVKQRQQPGGREAVIPEGVFQSSLFSPAIKVGNLVFVSGTVAMDAKKQIAGKKNDFRAQAEFVFKSLQAHLEAAGSGMDRLVRVNVFLTDARNYDILNDVWSEFVSSWCVPPPTRTTVVSALVMPELLIEIDAIALA